MYMWENVKISKIVNKKNKLLKKDCKCFISFGQMSLSESI